MRVIRPWITRDLWLLDGARQDNFPRGQFPSEE